LKNKFKKKTFHYLTQCDLTEDLNLKRCGFLDHSALCWMQTFDKRKDPCWMAVFGRVWNGVEITAQEKVKRDVGRHKT